MFQGRRGRGVGETAGASSKNINPSIWRVMAAFETSPYRSILSSRARSVRWGCEGWAGGGLHVKPCAFVLQPCPHRLHSGDRAACCAQMQHPSPHLTSFCCTLSLRDCGGGESQVVILFFVSSSIFFFFFFHLPPSPWASPPPSK